MLLRVAALVLVASAADAATLMRIGPAGSGAASYDAKLRTLTSAGDASFFYRTKENRHSKEASNLIAATYSLSLTFAQPIYREVKTSVYSRPWITSYDSFVRLSAPVTSLTLTIRDKTNPSVRLLEYTAPANSLQFLDSSGYKWFRTSKGREWTALSTLCNTACSYYLRPYDIGAFLTNGEIGANIQSDLPGLQVDYYNTNARLLAINFGPLPWANREDGLRPVSRFIEGPRVSALSFRIESAVPEPATWAMMILGFGLVGASMRRRNLAAA